MRSDEYRASRVEANLRQVNREIAGLARLCGVELRAPGATDRVLRCDASVCRTVNVRAFTKLQGLLVMHFTLLARLAGG